MRRVSRFATTAALAVLTFAAPVAAADVWQIDGTHSAVQFSVKHMMIATVRGEFGKMSGTIEYDGTNPASIKVDATIEVSTVNTREPKRDEHLKSPDFFDVAKFPTATFKSKQAVAGAAGTVKLVGDLTLRGVTKEITLEVTGPTQTIKDPRGNLKIGATATGKINRQDFGVSWSKPLDGGGVVVSDEVALTIDIEAGRKPDAPAAK